jgi:homoserine kinase
VAAAAAAGAPDPFQYGFLIDGHPENAAASAFGGLVTATVIAGQPVARKLCLDSELRFVVIVPDRHLATCSARRVLPPTVPHADAAFNLGRLGLLIAGLADHRGLVAGAGDDRLHQSQRSVLFPEAQALLDGFRAAGALTSCWSGAGPCLLAICAAPQAEAVARGAEAQMAELKVAGKVLTMGAAVEGVSTEELG